MVHELDQGLTRLFQKNDLGKSRELLTVKILSSNLLLKQIKQQFVFHHLLVQVHGPGLQ